MNSSLEATDTPIVSLLNKKFEVQIWHWKIDWILNEPSNSNVKLDGTEHQ